MTILHPMMPPEPRAPIAPPRPPAGPAGAPALPSSSRRGFLARAAGALAGSSVVGLVAVALLPENPDLLALGERIEPLLAAYRAALARYNEARATAEANCPAVPDEIVVKGPQWHICAEREQDVDGKDVWPPNYVGEDGKTYVRAPRYLLNSVYTRAAVERGNLYCDGRTRFGKQLRKLISIAERYEAEREAAIEASGIRDAAHNRYLAAVDIERLAYDVREFEPRTMAGVLIHARALTAMRESSDDKWSQKAAAALGDGLADAVVRLAGGAERMGAANV